MNPDCKYCPPPNFETHTECHIESTRFRLNTERLKQIKENISQRRIDILCNKKHQIDQLYQLSTNETEYRYFALKLKQLNDTIDFFIRTRWVKLI